MDELNELNALLENLPGYTLVTPSMKTSALTGARIPDSAGVWPGVEGYVDTYDVYFAAVSLLAFLQAQPIVTHTSSEGTSVTATPFNWGAVKAFYEGLSPIMARIKGDVLTAVPIPDPPHVTRVPMNDKGGYYGDVNTDLN